MLNKRIVVILFFFLTLTATLSLVSANDLTDDVVNASDDEASVGSSIDDITSEKNVNEDILEMKFDDNHLESSNKGTFTELQNKINNAKKGATISLNMDYSYNKGFSTNGIRITKTITIDGKGHKIDGLKKSALFLINKANNVVLKNIVFENGCARGFGSVCILDSNNVKLDNCHFFKNTADFLMDGDEYISYGGAIFMSNSDHSSFVGCTFDSSDTLCGAVSLTNCHDSSFKKCRFDSNYGENGGAVYLDGCDRSSFINCNFLYNDATKGGAVFLEDCHDSSFKKCRFESNVADVCGGAVYLLESSSSFASCEFTDNSLYKGIFRANGWSGGALFSVRSVLDIVNCEFSDNYAKSSGGDISSQYSIVFLSNSSFKQSYCDGFGGALSFDNDFVQINNCIFEECISESNGGGGIYCFSSILNCYSSQFKGCKAEDYGGAICSLNTELDIKNNKFYSNYARFGGSIYTLYGSVAVDNSIFSYSCAELGGAIHVRSPHTINKITNNVVLYSSSQKGPKILIEEYNNYEFPKRGNIYEDVYFVYGKFNNSDGNGSLSNVLTYVVSNSDEFHKDLSFYNNLRDEFISNYVLSNSSNNHFNIFDEDNPNNSTIFLNYNSPVNPKITYDVGHFYNEFNESKLDINFYNLDGDVLKYLWILPILNSSNNSKLNSSFYHILYFSSVKGGGTSLYPVFSDENNITVFNNDYDNPYAWVCQVNPDDYCNYKINGTFSFDLSYDGLSFGYINFYNNRVNIYPTPLFNQDYDMEMLPSSYCSLDYGYVTPVKDQDIGSNCWAFAGIATLETCLKKITGVDYDFSENNAKNLMASSSIFGLSIDSNGGGYDTMFMGYLTSWLGPVYERYDNYNPLSSLSPELGAAFHIQNIAFLSPRHNSFDNDEIKYAIMNYGAVSVIFDWVSEDYNGYHAVSIVGWDDDYEDNDCLDNESKGAWIFKNSWGDEWIDSYDKVGFGYLSYEQKLSGEIEPHMHAYSFIFDDGDVGYQDIYQYEFVGLTDFLCADSVYYKNKFIARGNEYLHAFSTYFEKPTYFTYSVRINGKDITQDEYNNTIANSLHYSSAGYHTISLGYNLTLYKGDEFEIIIKLENCGMNYVPVCQADELYKSSYPSNVSFLSYDGQEWFDLYDLSSNNMFAYAGNKSNTCQVACIKAFTTLWSDESDMNLVELDNGTVLNELYKIYQLNTQISEDKKSIKFDIVDWHHDYLEAYQNFIELNVNNGEHIYYLKIVNGSAKLGIGKWGNGFYKCNAKLKSNCFGSDLVTFDFVLGNDANSSTFSKLEEIINNANEGSVVILDENYYADFNESCILINKSITIDGNDHILTGMFKSGVFKISHDCNVTLKNIYFTNGNATIISNGDLKILNCSFIKNHAEYGGAIYFNGNCIIINSTFKSNYAKVNGGAIFSENKCLIINSTFKSNYAGVSGGAIVSIGQCTITDSNFNFNNASFAGAIYSNNYTHISDSTFTNNHAQTNAGAIYLYEDSISYFRNDKFYSNHAEYGGAIEIYDSTCYMDNVIFNKNIANDEGGAIVARLYSNLTIINSNFKDNEAEYGGSIFSVFNLSITNSEFKSNNAGGELIYMGDSMDEDTYFGNLYLKNNKMVSGANAVAIRYRMFGIPYKGKLYLVFNKISSIEGGYANLCQVVDEDGTTFDLPCVDVELTNRNANTINEVIYYDDDLKGYVLYNYELNYGTYKLTGSIPEYFASNWTVKNGILYVTKKSVLKASSLTKVYGTNTKLKVTLKDSGGKVITNKYLTVKLNGKTLKIKTNSKGKATLSLKLAPKKYTATITFLGNTKYSSATKKVKITVKKATPKITTKRKTFKIKTKVKKYVIILKNNLGKAMKKTKVTIKVNGHTYKAKTNNKGQATFKIKNLKKIGTFTATIKYNSSKCYNAVSKKVKIIVKK